MDIHINIGDAQTHCAKFTGKSHYVRCIEVVIRSGFCDWPLHTGMRAARIVSLGVFDVLLSVGPPPSAYIA